MLEALEHTCPTCMTPGGEIRRFLHDPNGTWSRSASQEGPDSGIMPVILVS